MVPPPFLQVTLSPTRAISGIGRLLFPFLVSFRPGVLGMPQQLFDAFPEARCPTLGQGGQGSDLRDEPLLAGSDDLERAVADHLQLVSLGVEEYLLPPLGIVERQLVE